MICSILAANLLNDSSAAEDVVQDVFVTLAQSADKINLRDNLKGYLLTCVANRSRDYSRSKYPTCKSLWEITWNEYR